MKLNLKDASYFLLKALLYIVSFWIPVIGIVLWLMNRKSNPKLAKNILIVSLVGFGANYILSYLR